MNDVPTELITPTCKLDEGSHVRGCWDGLFHIDKLKMVCTLYKLLESFFPLSYDFGMMYISLTYEVCVPHISSLIC